MQNDNGMESLFIYNNFANLAIFLFLLTCYQLSLLCCKKRKTYKIFEWDLFLGDLYAQILPLSLSMFL